MRQHHRQRHRHLYVLLQRIITRLHIIHKSVEINKLILNLILSVHSNF